jgi:hypothetical protein
MRYPNPLVTVCALLCTIAGGASGQEFFDTKPPAKPAAGETAAPADPARTIEKISGTRFKLGAMEFDQATREIFVPAKVNMREGLLEYILVHESGKTHESLFSTAVKPTEFNVVMLLLNWKQSNAFFDFTEPERGGVPAPNAVNPPESQLEIHLAWKDAAGAAKSARIEDWLHQVEKKSKITQEPFIYTGSRIMPDGQFLAEQTGSIVALYVDPASIVNNPREGNELDDVWIPDPAVPDKGAEVTIVFKPAAAPAKPKAKSGAAKPSKN